MRIAGIIPARYASTRFPGKPLAEIRGKSMVQRVYERASVSTALAEVWVATDDERIARHVEGFGGRVVMTDSAHPSGTDRCYEAACRLEVKPDAVVNIQGDEPFVALSQLDALAKLIQQDGVALATLIRRIHSEAELHSPDKVKVVVDQHLRALYFSRSVIPFYRGAVEGALLETHTYYKHIGLYAYTLQALEEVVQLPPSALERAESLEQLRWLENGHQVHCALTEVESPSIDTPDDLQALLKRADLDF